MANSIALPMRYRALTARPEDGGVLTETIHLRESRRMFGVGAFSLTERIGGAHALAPHLITTCTTTTPPVPTRGDAHALAPRVAPTPITTRGDAHARPPLPGEAHALAPYVGDRPYA